MFNFTHTIKMTVGNYHLVLVEKDGRELGKWWMTTEQIAERFE